MKLAGDLIPSVDSIPFDKLLIKLKNQNDATVSAVYGALNDYIKTRGIKAIIWDYRDFSASIA